MVFIFVHHSALNLEKLLMLLFCRTKNRTQSKANFGAKDEFWNNVGGFHFGTAKVFFLSILLGFGAFLREKSKKAIYFNFWGGERESKIEKVCYFQNILGHFLELFIE